MIESCNWIDFISVTYATEGVAEHSSRLQPSINLHAPVTVSYYLANFWWYIILYIFFCPVLTQQSHCIFCAHYLVMLLVGNLNCVIRDSSRTWSGCTREWTSSSSDDVIAPRSTRSCCSVWSTSTRSSSSDASSSCSAGTSSTTSTTPTSRSVSRRTALTWLSMFLRTNNLWCKKLRRDCLEVSSPGMSTYMKTFISYSFTLLSLSLSAFSRMKSCSSGLGVCSDVCSWIS